jgi:hypothetical protein
MKPYNRTRSVSKAVDQDVSTQSLIACSAWEHEFEEHDIYYPCVFEFRVPFGGPTGEEPSNALYSRGLE